MPLVVETSRGEVSPIPTLLADGIWDATQVGLGMAMAKMCCMLLGCLCRDTGVEVGIGSSNPPLGLGITTLGLETLPGLRGQLVQALEEKELVKRLI